MSLVDTVQCKCYDGGEGMNLIFQQTCCVAPDWENFIFLEKVKINYWILTFTIFCENAIFSPKITEQHDTG